MSKKIGGITKPQRRLGRAQLPVIAELPEPDQGPVDQGSMHIKKSA